MKNYQSIELDKKVIKRARTALEHNYNTPIRDLIPADIPTNSLAYCRYYALFESYASVLYAQHNGIKPLEYLAIYANWKNQEYSLNSDLGAYGDLVESCIHCIAKRKANLIKLTDIRVKPLTLKSDGNSVRVSKIDVSINGVGYEVAHNGKTLTESTEFDYMAGEYTGFIYGVIDREEMQEIVNLLIAHEFKKAFSMLSRIMYVWTDKYEFLHDINSVSRGKGITYKSHINAAQIVYNDSKHNAFIKYIEDSKIPRLYDVLVANSDLLF